MLFDAGFQPFYRRLRYKDDIDGATRPHSLVVNALGATLTWRPLASSRVELTAAGELSFGAQGEADSTATKYPTHASEWSVAAGAGGAAVPRTRA